MCIENIIKLPEGKTLEFKENIHSKEKIVSTIIAFANTSGGTLIIGVQDKTKHIVGVESPHKIAEAITSMVYDSIEPRILPNVEVIPYRSTYLVKVEVYPSFLRPHFKRKEGKFNSTYVRIGSTTRLADKDLLYTIEKTTTNQSFDENPCYEINYETLDVDYISQLFAHQKPITVETLITLGLAFKEKNKIFPTVGGVLLFGRDRLKYFPDAWIQLGVFDGLDKSKILNSQKVDSYLTGASEEVLNFIKKNLRIGLKIEDLAHEEVWEIPKIALREAIINAIVHTDYSLKGAPLRVAIFLDRIEIENSALLPWGLTFEDLKSGVSKLRNPVIARVFNELKLIEQWGSGIKRMIDACEKAGLPPPVFEEIGPRIRVTFYKKKIKKPELDTIDKKILELFKENNSLSTQDVADAIKQSKRSVIYRLTELVDKGFLAAIAQSATDPQKKYRLI